MEGTRTFLFLFQGSGQKWVEGKSVCVGLGMKWRDDESDQEIPFPRT